VGKSEMVIERESNATAYDRSNGSFDC